MRNIDEEIENITHELEEIEMVYAYGKTWWQARMTEQKALKQPIEKMEKPEVIQHFIQQDKQAVKDVQQFARKKSRYTKRLGAA